MARFHENAKQIVRSEAKLAAGQPDDAGIARPVHFNLGSPVESEFLQPMHMVQMAVNPPNLGRLTNS